ncbi:MAG: hypothetical protein C1O27_001670 [Chloroflexi bacterium]|jgi:hypothetical protein|nr:MAG: hypothetical protein C1O27_001670 [Chloroflexota bacterium]
MPTTLYPTSTRDGLTRVTIWCAYTSGIVSIFGIVFLVAFFSSFVGMLGVLNDIAVVIQHFLMIPIALGLHKILRPSRPSLSQVGLLLGLVGMLVVIVLQLLFMTGVLPYSQYIGLVTAGFMVVLGWFLVVRNLHQSTEIVPRSVALTVLAGLYFGYPLWAFSLGRRLRALDRD